METARDDIAQLPAVLASESDIVMLPSLGRIDRRDYFRLSWRGFARLYRREFPGVPRGVTREWGKRIVRERELARHARRDP